MPKCSVGEGLVTNVEDLLWNLCFEFLPLSPSLHALGDVAIHVAD